MSGRPWTYAERIIIRRHIAAGHSPRSMLADLPARSLRAVYQAMRNLGLARPVKELFVGFEPIIRARHAEQWSDQEIAEELSRLKGFFVSRGCVAERRKKLGLRANGNCDRLRARVSRQTREQLKKAALPSLAALHRRVIQDRIEAMGWPRDLRWREAQILSLIWDKGPQTKHEICAALAMPFKGSRGSLKSNDPGGTYLATLMRRGLVISYRRAVRTGRRGGNVDLYSLSLDIQRRKAAHVERYKQRQWETPALAKDGAGRGRNLRVEPDGAAAVAQVVA